MSIPWYKSQPLRYDSPRKLNINYSAEHDLDFLLTYPSNFIKTSRYTFLTFLPFSLFGQFRRYANIYFLFIAIIQCIPEISPLNPFSAIAPLVFVLGLSMVREAMEDITRHKSDNEVNAMEAQIIKNGKITKTTWANVCVGDLVLMEQDEMFPADLIVLGSEIASGACYIETSSLDGEKNLKPKSSILETQQIFNKKETAFKEKIIIEAQKPSQALYEFDGSITLPTGNKQYRKYIEGPKQLLLRGAFLRNTKWVIGAVIYTGEDTKIMRNAEPGRTKQSNIELGMNGLIVGILWFQILCCCISACCAAWWMNDQGSRHWYVWQDSDSPTLQAFLVFFSYFLLYNTMIPISLIVSLEFVKVFQCIFIESDEEMYVASRGKYARAQTSTINEELGQVEYIFSDKTGTLTCNQMEFKYCIIGNTLYGDQKEDNNQVLLSNEDDQIKQPLTQNVKDKKNKDEPEQPKPAAFQHSIFTFKDEELSGVIQNKANYVHQAQHNVGYHFSSNDGEVQASYPQQRDLILEYFFLLSSTHECIVQVDEKTGATSYQGPSPDEITLVDAAMNLGFKYVNGSASEQEFKMLGKDKKIKLLNLKEFDSTRKRMSVVIRDEGKIKLFIKGADNIIKMRLSKYNQPFLPFIDDKLSEFSKIGLRTLLMAMKVLSEAEYESFNKSLTALSDSPNKAVEEDELYDKFENQLQLIGATAVEDKLQFQVPETIADLLRANIKIWMLTGDKLETAENIARSCRLIQGDMTVLRLSEKEEQALHHKLVDNKATYDLCVKEHRKKSFLVEGESLALIIGHEAMEKIFVNMAKNCESVVCCRVTPKQKAQVVKMIKDNLNKVTLAIGDGANDVNMIQEAHIGIGLYGNEGMRAVQSSDFALGEFRCLWRLLLVHGHWSYIRIAEMVLYFFYKNMIFTIPQFWFAFFSAYSGQTFFDDWYITFYNLFFTALPLIARATLDQNVNYRITSLVDAKGQQVDFLNKQEKYLRNKFPEIYYVGQQKTIFTIPNFIFWAGQGFIHGVLVFFFTLACYYHGVLTKDGHPVNLAALSLTVYTAIIFIVDFKIALYTKFWTWLNFLCITVLSIGIYIIYFCISNFFKDTFSEYTPLYLLSSPNFYLIIIFLNTGIFIFDIVVSQVVRELYKNPINEMLKFKMEMIELAQKDHEVYKAIEQVQLDKRVQGYGNERQWGESFLEEIVEEIHLKERESNNLVQVTNNPQQANRIQIIV